MMTKLNKADIGFNKYCGPAVLSILTGKNTDECAKVIREIDPSWNGSALLLTSLIKAADKLGYKSTPIQPSGFSLFRTLVMLAKKNGVYIITLPSHFVTIEVAEDDIYFCDNHTKEPMKACNSARLQQNVVSVYRVEPKPVPKIISSDIQARLSGHTIWIVKVNTYDDYKSENIAMGSIYIKEARDIDYIIRELEMLQGAKV